MNLQFVISNFVICNSCGGLTVSAAEKVFRLQNFKLPNYKILHLTRCVDFVLLTPWNSEKSITRSWVITGDDVIEPAPRSQACRFCGVSAQPAQVIANLPGVDGGAWSARPVVHPHALYHIEGEAARRGDGLYDRMGSIGAHEVLLENPRHDGHLWNASDLEI